jgi:histidinol-phosphate/aromatic aminotransferase/cobyric acid decarboxylase-like protein
MSQTTRKRRARTAACAHGGAFWDAIGDEFAALSRRRAVINADVLDAWFPPAPRIVRTLSRHLDWIVRTSPPTGCEGLTRAIARASGVPHEHILAGDGSSSLMFQGLTHWLDAGSRVLLPDPTYGEYAHILQHLVGCRIDRLELPASDGFRLDPNDLAVRLELERFDLAVIVNPNSPTGRHVPRKDLQRVIANAPQHTRFWIDETYVDYAGADQSLERFAARSHNVIVCKSLSKVYALSGVRVGYLCAAPQLLDELRRRTPPWAVSFPAQVAAVIAFEEQAYYRARWKQTAELREELATALAARLGIAAVPSVANFLLCELPPGGLDAAALVRRCAARGLYLRELATLSRLFSPRAFRIAVKDRATNRKMLRILGTALGARWP